MMSEDEKYISRCIQLAENGKGFVAPNPMVGSVIVRNGKIIGEGFHRKYGEAHAEVNAIASVKDDSLLRESTLYVNLEPCSHHGKTPPCSQLIIEKKIPRVVIGHVDPYHEVAGRGIRMLEDAGIEVVCNVLKSDCEELNKRFITFHRDNRPFIILKWAQSSDGFMDRKRNPGDGQTAYQFSGPLTRAAVHKLRSEEAAIMVGTRTALLDNPSLTVRFWSGRNPLRIIPDRNNTLPDDLKIFDDSAPTWVFAGESPENTKKNVYVVNFNKDVLTQIMDELYKKEIQSLIVEGGATLLKSFLEKGLWDEIHQEVSGVSLHEGVQAPYVKGKCVNVQKCENSVISVYKNDFIL